MNVPCVVVSSNSTFFIRLTLSRSTAFVVPAFDIKVLQYHQSSILNHSHRSKDFPVNLFPHRPMKNSINSLVYLSVGCNLNRAGMIK